jgi:hypothetical protein
MRSLSDKQIAEYFNRLYKTVDGLWFMKVEESYGFTAALQIDKEVWKVMPKIQARLVKSMLNLNKDAAGLLTSLKTKLALEGFKFTVKKTEDGFSIQISDCPWHNLMLKSGREEFSEKVGTTICSVEYCVWVSEFDKNMRFTLAGQKCKGSEFCMLNFKKC